MSNDNEGNEGFEIWYEHETSAREAEAEYSYQKENNKELEEVFAKRANDADISVERLRESRRNLHAAKQAAQLRRRRADAYMEVVKLSIQIEP